MMTLLKDLPLHGSAVQAAALLRAADAGSGRWWARVAASGTPLVERVAAARCCVTFLWRDPAGDEAASPICRVYADVNSVTDHHSFAPQSLARIAGTDIWYWQVELPSGWRGSYAFIPVTAAQLPPAPEGDAEARRMQQRRWWMRIAGLAIADPLNPHLPLVTGWGPMSAAHLPDAPDQAAWRSLDEGRAQHDPARLHEFTWQEHRIQVYATQSGAGGQGDRQRPLVLLLDGQHWGGSMPVFAALDETTADGRLPGAVYVLIDAIDGACRERDLACNAGFWRDVQQQLLPRVAAIAPHSADGERTVVAGQSLGGLAAMYAGLHWPQRFGRVLSQSGSFWWPHVELLHAPPGEPCLRKPGARGWLAGQVEAGNLPAGRLVVYQEVGSREDVMIDVNDSLRDALQAAGHSIVAYVVFEGGHDRLCWRGGLIDGLVTLCREWR